MNRLPSNISPTLHQRFWSRVTKIDGGCWLFRGPDRQGYSELRVTTHQDDPKEYSHRLSFMLNVGEIHDGLHVLHHCDNRRCVNPEHLFLGTNDDNIADKIAKGRQPKGERSGGARYDEATIRRVRELRASGLTLRAIAAQTGIRDFRYVSDIAKHKTWRHVAA